MPTLLIYGATGYSGKLIANAATRAKPLKNWRVLLAARDGRTLAKLSGELELDFRVFGLDNPIERVRGLADVDVVLNAAGPFASTASRLATAALQIPCHYTDINGEVDVYKQVDDLGQRAQALGVRMVGGAGYSGAASNVLLSKALDDLETAGVLDRTGRRLGAIRIAHARVMDVSRGSAGTAWRLLREDVTVVRDGPPTNDPTSNRRRPVLSHEPVGRLERSFDFGKRDSGPVGARIASAANLVDTLTARMSLIRRGVRIDRLESYLEMNAPARLGYQLGSLVAPIAAMGWVSRLARLTIDQLPEGPDEAQRKGEPAAVVLQIDSPLGEPLVDWLWPTPNVYDFTATLALRVAQAVSESGVGPLGWCAPAEVLKADALEQELARVQKRKLPVPRKQTGS